MVLPKPPLYDTSYCWDTDLGVENEDQSNWVINNPMSYKGYFKPKNPSKYLGNTTNIVYRSLWELKFMSYLDSHPNVINWASEEFSIPYISPIDNKIHKYYPDFWLKKKNSNGILETVVVEIKPAAQSREPSVQKTRSRKYIKEVVTWGVNSAKWKAAKTFCEDRKWKFMILTEHDLGI